ncbi:hypothetical protein [Rhodococcus olei]|uniref:FDXHR family putative zinc-binding protein n=1 Tax=Rhodococcus olei TaxID=2161675 RepID=UPI0031EB0933
MTTQINTCNGCPARWSGLNTAHCAGCHVTFTGPSAFDRHRVKSTCATPAEIGLKSADRAYPCFGYPMRDDALSFFDGLGIAG